MAPLCTFVFNDISLHMMHFILKDEHQRQRTGRPAAVSQSKTVPRAQNRTHAGAGCGRRYRGQTEREILSQTAAQGQPAAAEPTQNYLRRFRRTTAQGLGRRVSIKKGAEAPFKRVRCPYDRRRRIPLSRPPSARKAPPAMPTRNSGLAVVGISVASSITINSVGSSIARAKRSSGR